MVYRDADEGSFDVAVDTGKARRWTVVRQGGGGWKEFCVTFDAAAGSFGGGGPRGALDHLAFGVADRATLDAWAAWLDSLTVPHGGVVDRTDPTGYATLEFRDPDGIALEFIHFPGRG